MKSKLTIYDHYDDVPSIGDIVLFLDHNNEGYRPEDYLVFDSRERLSSKIELNFKKRVIRNKRLIQNNLKIKSLREYNSEETWSNDHYYLDTVSFGIVIGVRREIEVAANNKSIEIIKAAVFWSKLPQYPFAFKYMQTPHEHTQIEFYPTSNLFRLNFDYFSFQDAT